MKTNQMRNAECGMRNNGPGRGGGANSFRAPHSALRTSPAFTLVELLFVIVIIGILAALLLPTIAAVKRVALINRTKTEMAQLESAITDYKGALGFYPPDSPSNPRVNQLYFELLGTRQTNISGNDIYFTLDNSAQMPAVSVPSAFPGVSGFMNCNRTNAPEDAPVARSFLKDLKTTQILTFSNGSGVSITVLVGSVGWGGRPGTEPIPGVVGFTPWSYNSSSPTNNPGGYDLWIDIYLGGKTNRISNWNSQTTVVAY